MNMDSSALSNIPAVELTNESVVSNKRRIAPTAVPIDLHLDLTQEGPYLKDNFEDDEQFTGVFQNDHHEKKNGTTLAVIAIMMLFLFLLAGISITFSDRASNLSLLKAQSSSTEQLSVATSESENVAQGETMAAEDASLKSVTDILSSRISLISSSEPKFIVTAEGEKIVPDDTIGDGLKVVDILSDHMLVSSNGETHELNY